MKRMMYCRDKHSNVLCLVEYESIQDELKAEDEWLTTKREQGEILDEIEEDRLNDELEESERVWESLGMLD